MQKKVFSNLYRLHTLIGIFISLNCLVLFLSGAILIFKDDLEKAFAKSTAAESVTTETTAATAKEKSAGEGIAEIPEPRADLYDFILQQALKDHPADRPLSLFPDEDDPTTLQLRMGLDGSREFRGARRLVFDAQTGLPKVSRASESSFFSLVLRLHRDIFLGSWGKLYVGFIGLLYIFILISGFLIYGNFAKKSAYGEIRRQSSRGFFSDLHRFVGATIFAWSLLVGFTGMLLAFNSTLIKIYQYRELRALNAEYRNQAPVIDNVVVATASLDRVAATVKQAKPDSKISFIAFPDTQFSVPNHFIVLVKNNTEGFAQNISELVIVKAATAELVEVRKLPVYMKMLMLSEPLHFGNYGGLVLKMIWLLFALGSCVLPVSGLMVFYRRKRRSASAPMAAPPIRLVEAQRTLSPRPAYFWPLLWSMIFVVSMALPLISLGYMPWGATLLAGIPAALTIFLLGRIFMRGPSA